APGQAKDPNKPNQVTEAEFQKMVATYSDIDRNKTNLRIQGPTAEGASEEMRKNFRERTLEDLSRIMQTESGRKMIEEIARNPKGKQTTIGFGYSGDPGDARSLSSNERVPNVCTPTNAPYPNASNGTGIDASVRYNPFDNTNICATTPPMRSDMVLYHELVH